MANEERNRIVTGFAVAIVMVFFAIGLIAKHNRSQNRQPRKEFGKIYRAEDGRYYTRCHDRKGFSDWEYTAGGDAAGGETSGSLGNGTWFRVSSTPSGMSATSKVVAEEDGKPTGVVEEESAATNNEEITESTTESEADSMDSASESGGDSSGDSGSSDSGGGDGGGDGGGGDGGGGSD
jgi:uncharacterized membrane protein YgcG